MFRTTDRLLGAVAMVSLAALLTACVVPQPGLYVGGVRQPEGLVALSERTYSFRFAERWRISHRWVQGASVSPCHYWSNIFHRSVRGFPLLSAETEAQMFDKSGKVYVANVLPRAPLDVYFFEASNRVQGEMPNGFQRTGYTPFCSQGFLPFSNGMALWIVKPDPAKGTDEWIADAREVVINGRTWLVKKLPPKDLGSDSPIASAMEFWTLKIPGTPYWLHLRFSGSQRSVRQFAAEHARLLSLFQQVIESIHLEPITPVSPQDMPPFVDDAGRPIE